MAVKLAGKNIQVEIWTDQLRITGSMFIPGSHEEAYDTRVSDALNSAERTFIALTKVKVRHVGGNDVLWDGKFLAINKNQITLVRELKE